MSNAIGERQAASLASSSLVARAQPPIENTMRSWRTIFSLVEVSLIRLKLGDGDNLLGRQDRELNMFAV